MLKSISMKAVCLKGVRFATVVFSVALLVILVGTCLPASNAQTVTAETYGTGEEAIYVFGDENGRYYTSDGELVFDTQDFFDSYSDSDDDPFYYVFLFLLLPPMIFVGIMVKKAKEEKAAPVRNPSEAGTDAFGHWADNYLPEINQAPRQDVAPKKANYPITCPGCGATAYPNDDGTCQYCGRAIYDPRA